jgi:acetyl-CoA synthetase
MGSALEWDFKTPEIKWFQGAQLNMQENCLDRHLYASGEKRLLFFEPNDPERKKQQHITYKNYTSAFCKSQTFLNKASSEGRVFICL